MKYLVRMAVVCILVTTPGPIHSQAVDRLTTPHSASMQVIHGKPYVMVSINGKGPGNNHHKFGGNFLMTDGSVQASDAQLTFSLAGRPGVVLLNPKP